MLEAERRLLRAREEQRAAERQAERLRDAAVLQGLEEADLCARDDAAHCLALREVRQSAPTCPRESPMRAGYHRVLYHVLCG